jgi:gamma-glutamyltranspeptidase/glutathione hydrolase
MRNFKKWAIIVLILIFCSSHNSEKEDFQITATMSQKGIDAGMKILAEGGTAIDAALSVALSEIAETGGKFISYAGLIDLVYYEKKTDKIYNMNAGFNTIQNETDPFTIPGVAYNTSLTNTKYDTLQNTVNGRTILVPGFMKGVGEAHKRFGKVPFARLLENAIEIAERGTEWTDIDNTSFLRSKNVLTKYPETKAIFTRPNGNFYKVGEIFKQPELAKTLRKISSEGADYMYTGEWAKKFVNAARNIGSKITLKDMQDYNVIWTNPVHGNYKGYDIYVNGQPDLGGSRLIEALNIAELVNLSEMGHYSESPSALATIYQILAAVSYSSNIQSNYGDRVDLTDKKTSEHIWEFWKTKNNFNVPQFKKNKNEHSSAIVAVDRWGNIAALVHSINTVNWGSTGLFVDGISIPDPACFQQEMIGKTGPGKRLPGETIPGLVFKNGQPVLGFACIGSGLHPQTFISLLNVLDFKMTPQESVEKPGIGEFSHEQNKLSLSIEPKRFSDTVISRASRINSSFHESSSVKNSFWTGIYIDKENGILQGTKVRMK